MDARYGLEAEYSDSNPMLVELRAQTGYLEKLSDYIGRVFAPSPNSKGPALRVIRGRKINCVMRRFFPSSSVGDRPAPRGCTSTPDERKVTTI